MDGFWCRELYNWFWVLPLVSVLLRGGNFRGVTFLGVNVFFGASATFVTLNCFLGIVLGTAREVGLVLAGCGSITGGASLYQANCLTIYGVTTNGDTRV